MKLVITTKRNPSELKSEIISLIENGDKQTWDIKIFKEVKYLKHIKQWGDKGVIRLTYKENEKQLFAKVLKYENVEEDVEDFEGYYLGRFCEILFVDFPTKFTTIELEEL